MVMAMVVAVVRTAALMLMFVRLVFIRSVRVGPDVVALELGGLVADGESTRRAVSGGVGIVVFVVFGGSDDAGTANEGEWAVVGRRYIAGA
jgi:hypothetical protein